MLVIFKVFLYDKQENLNPTRVCFIFANYNFKDCLST